MSSLQDWYVFILIIIFHGAVLWYLFAGAAFLQREAKRGTSFDDIREQFVSICVGFNVQTEPVCEGIFNVYGPELLPVLNITELGIL